MGAPARNPGAPEASQTPPHAVRLGKRIVVIVLVVYTLALCGFAARSWLPQAFWPQPSRAAVARVHGLSCAEGLAGLRTELDRRVGSWMSQPPVNDAACDRFFASWDDRHAALAAACGRAGADPADARAALFRLRHRYAALVHRFVVDVVPLATDFGQRLSRAPSPPASPQDENP